MIKTAKSVPLAPFTGGSQKPPESSKKEGITSSCSIADIQTTYELLHVLGRGSFGVVSLARVRKTGKTVAIKKVLFDSRLHPRELVILRDHLGPAAQHSGVSNLSNSNTSRNRDEGENANMNNVSTEGKSISVEDATAIPTIVPYHPGIVQLLDHFYACGANGEQYLYIVMDYIPSDMYRLQYMYIQQKRQQMPLILVKVAMFQLARALVFLHTRGMCHRDIKPSNLLIDPETGVVKLCDFGAAKVMQSLDFKGPREKNVPYICSRYYRAPELLLGSLYYHFHVDMWAFGCVLAEFLCGEVLFKGSTTVDQMAEIFKVLGAPSRQELLTLNPQSAEALTLACRSWCDSSPAPNTSMSTTAPPPPPGAGGAAAAAAAASTTSTTAGSDYFQRYQALQIKALQWQNVLPPNTPASAVSLVGELLRYTPTERLSAIEVVQHPFFDELFTDDARLPNGAALPVSMFQVTSEESELFPLWLLERMGSAEILAKQLATETSKEEVPKQ
ncbi:glycogen synthase kinase-3 alpha [Trypanosoma theileri]|uniref:Glycogen synthase kinase-3 alpha n=1 Tax=Trypanosoma theileri TaxID=67003 RepID=A0A1X0NT84_9TRYP|nr:glycogen synthase kinase-3 alpha [Trypanosoma theileri]ORC87902.1 glycogen synthase kinase-3 alpha [Trypanosoma theileri]